MDTEPNFTEREIEAIEQIVFETAITMIYKLNDATFRPMFRKILGWSNQSRFEANSKASLHRQTTIYSFLGIFFSDLKVSLNQIPICLVRAHLSD
jgi:U3 small nucleolar RNA-associated protein 10